MSNSNIEIYESNDTANVTYSIGPDGRGRYCYDEAAAECVSEDDVLYDRGFGG